MNYLIKCKENNVKNIEMESAVFAAYTNYAKCKCKKLLSIFFFISNESENSSIKIHFNRFLCTYL